MTSLYHVACVPANEYITFKHVTSNRALTFLCSLDKIRDQSNSKHVFWAVGSSRWWPSSFCQVSSLVQVRIAGWKSFCVCMFLPTERVQLWLYLCIIGWTLQTFMSMDSIHIILVTYVFMPTSIGMVHIASRQNLTCNIVTWKGWQSVIKMLVEEIIMV